MRSRESIDLSPPSIRLHLFCALLLLMSILQQHQSDAFAVSSAAKQSNNSPKGVCGYQDRLNCARDRKSETLDDDALYTCEACGNIWSNIPGMAWCCRCNPKVFAFCWEKVHEQALIF